MTTHLSDEAIAAFADDVLTGHARERASRHAMACPECAHAVAVQREAVWALRAAPAPPLPSGLLDRLRDVPATTPVNRLPAAIGADGTAMFAAFGTVTGPLAAFVPTRPARGRRARRADAQHDLSAIAPPRLDVPPPGALPGA
jgi:anti-sigma factor RsiW